MDVGLRVDDRQDQSLTDAASIIKIIDSATNDARESVISASKEVEEAKRNARAASELAKKFMAMSSTPGTNRLLLESFDIRPESPQGTPQKKQKFPPSPLSSLNGRSPDRLWNTHRGSPRATTLSSERLARANADAVVSLNLELDRCKHHLEAEQMAHDETKALLAQTKSRNAQLEAQIEKLLNDMETQRENYGRKLDSLEHDLSLAHRRVTAAEEDAQLALDLAKQNTESRLEVEACLEETLQRMETLKSELYSKNMLVEATASSPSRPPPPPPPLPTSSGKHSDKSLDSHGVPLKSALKSVRFADSPSVAAGTTNETPQPKTNSRAEVSIGRQLLQRALSSGSPLSAPRLDESDAELGYQASVERSQRLQERIKQNALEVDVAAPSSVASSVTATPQGDLKDECSAATGALKNVTNILKASGRRLNLSGRWWNDKGTMVATGAREVETIARHYCTSVEVLLDQKLKEIVELESLCALWERGSV